MTQSINPARFETRYIGGRLSTKSHYHLDEGCYLLQDDDPRQMSVRAINHHELEVCPECWARFLLDMPSPERDASEQYKTEVYLTPSEYNRLSYVATENDIRSKQQVIDAAMRELHYSIEGDGPHPTPAPDAESPHSVHVRLPVEDQELAERCIEQSWYDSESTVYRTAVRGFINSFALARTHKRQITAPEPFPRSRTLLSPPPTADTDPNQPQSWEVASDPALADGGEATPPADRSQTTDTSQEGG